MQRKMTMKVQRRRITEEDMMKYLLFTQSEEFFALVTDSADSLGDTVDENYLKGATGGYMAALFLFFNCEDLKL